MKNLEKESYSEMMARNDACRMFIDEQHYHTSLRQEYVTTEQALWSPVSNRHCCWLFQPEGNPWGKRLWG